MICAPTWPLADSAPSHGLICIQRSHHEGSEKNSQEKGLYRQTHPWASVTGSADQGDVLDLPEVIGNTTGHGRDARVWVVQRPASEACIRSGMSSTKPNWEAMQAR
jgi:hypothetical protein